MPLPTVIALLALALGYLAERQNWLPLRYKSWMAQALIQIFYPCLILAALLVRLDLESLHELWLLPCLMALILVIGLGFGIMLENVVGLTDNGKRRSFRFLCLLPNYSYLPLMVAQTLWDDAGITLVALAGVGADLVLWTIGLPQIMPERRFNLRRLLVNPPLIALLLALLLLQPFMVVWLKFLQPILIPLRVIGSATVPVSMLLLGAHLARRTAGGHDRRAHSVLLGLRLLLIPGMACFLFWSMPGLLPAKAQYVLILIASMPGAIISVVLSEMHRASPEFTARHVLLGHLLWLGSGPAWLWLIMRLSS